MYAYVVYVFVSCCFVLSWSFVLIELCGCVLIVVSIYMCISIWTYIYIQKGLYVFFVCGRMAFAAVVNGYQNPGTVPSRPSQFERESATCTDVSISPALVLVRAYKDAWMDT